MKYWLVIIVFLLSCSVNFETHGIYECVPGMGFNAPTYTFDSRDSTTEIYSGINTFRLKFKDIETGEMITFYGDSNPFQYNCSCVEEFPDG